MSRYRTGLKHPKTDAIVLAYLQGKCHKDVSREHNVPYTTCVEIAARYIKWVPVLKKPTDAKVALDTQLEMCYSTRTATAGEQNEQTESRSTREMVPG